jgi:hypothetical protein
MILLSDDQVEVINIESGAVSTVHVNFYKRNNHRLIPYDEYYIFDSETGTLEKNQARIKEALDYGKIKEQIPTPEPETPKIRKKRITKKKS